MNIICCIDRILWATRMGSIAAPARWGRCSHCDGALPWVNGAYCCTRCGHDPPVHAND